MEVGTPGYCGATLVRPLAPDPQSNFHQVHHHMSIAADEGTPGPWSGSSSASGCFVRLKACSSKQRLPVWRDNACQTCGGVRLHVYD